MTKKEFTDSEFIEGLKFRNEAVMRVLYKKHFPPVLKYILNNNGNEDDARDIYQESMLVLYHNAQKENFKLSASIGTFIYAVARRMWLKHLQRNEKWLRVENEDEYSGEISLSNENLKLHEEKEIQFTKMNTALQSLGEPCKTLIEDFYVRHLSMDEIADKFGYTNSDNAKTQKYKCLQRLKKLFFENEKAGR
jgi:RNA polymerase sigma factor (sigma-70 family)